MHNKPPHSSRRADGLGDTPLGGLQDPRLLDLARSGFTAGYWDIILDPENPEALPDQVFFSPSQKRLIGFDDDEFPNLLSAWRDRIVPEDLAILDEHVRRHLNGELEHYEIQYRIQHRDGSLRWLLARGDITRDDRGRPIRWSGMTVDNTDDKFQEQAKAELSVIVASADAAIISCTPDGKINTWNAGAERIYGYTRQEALGRSYGMLLPASNVGSPQFLRRLAQGGRYQQIETIRRRKDGMLIDVSISMSPILDDGGRHVASSLIEHDITQRKNMQEALRRSEARFRSIFNQASVGIAQLGPEGVIEMVNPRLCEILGRTRTELLNHRLDEMIHPDDPFDFSGHLEGIRDGGSDSFSREMRCRTGHDEGMIWAYMTVTVIETPANQRNAFITILEDISARKSTEADLRRALLQLRELNMDLEQRIARRTESLTRKQELLQELLAQLNDAEQEERRRLAAHLHDYLPQILVAAKMKLARVQRLVDAPRGVELLNEVTHNLDDCLKYCRTLISELSPNTLYEFGLEAAMPTLVRMIGDMGMDVEIRSQGAAKPLPEQLAGFLYRAVRELLYNAAKHAQADRAQVEFDWRDSPVRITVSDSGAGFDPDLVRQNQIAQGSFGLLNIEQRLTTLGGEIRIASSPGDGTRIEILAPVALPPTDADTPLLPRKTETSADRIRPKDGPALNRPLRILIADDHEMVRRGLRSMVQGWSWVEVVGEALDGAEAVALAVSRKPDVVLMDVRMPVMNGVEATRRIREELPATQIIGLAVRPEPALLRVMREAGAAFLLPKETGPEQLRDSICQCCHIADAAAPESAGA